MQSVVSGFLHIAKRLFLRSIHVSSCIRSLFAFIAEKYSIVWTYHILFTHSLELFPVWSVMNNVALATPVRVFVWEEG